MVDNKKAADRLTDAPEKEVVFQFAEPEPLGVSGTVLALKKVTFGFAKEKNNTDNKQAEGTEAEDDSKQTAAASSSEEANDEKDAAEADADNAEAVAAKDDETDESAASTAATAKPVKTFRVSGGDSNSADQQKKKPLMVASINIKTAPQQSDSEFKRSEEKRLLKNVNVIFRNVSMDISPASRIAVLGVNGSGKSTLLNSLMGVYTPVLGSYYVHHNLRMAYFTQHHVEQIDLSMTPLEHMIKLFPSQKEHALRAQLGRFGITGGLATQLMATLSGGQRSRVVFATITYHRPHFLLLDEPTNHLDWASIEALIKAIDDFKGAVIIVSHDQNLLSRVGKELYVVDSQRISRFEGSFEEYRKQMIRKLRIEEGGEGEDDNDGDDDGDG